MNILFAGTGDVIQAELMVEGKISVIIPTCNRADKVVRAISSVQAQTWNDLEIIVSDDVSTDGTKEAVERIAKTDNRIRYLRNEKKSGGSATRNNGIKKARGECVAFLDDDDWWEPNKLERQMLYWKNHPDSPAISCFYKVHYPFSITKLVAVPSGLSLDALLSNNSLGGASVCMVRHHALAQSGGFDESLQGGQDWDLWVKLRRQGPIAVCPEMLVHYDASLEYRMTRDMPKKYRSTRKFYFKYRAEMGSESRRFLLSMVFFFKSRNRKIGFSSRMKALCGAWRLSPVRRGIAYVASSGLRMLYEGIIGIRDK